MLHLQPPHKVSARVHDQTYMTLIGKHLDSLSDECGGSEEPESLPECGEEEIGVDLGIKSGEVPSVSPQFAATGHALWKLGRIFRYRLRSALQAIELQ